MKHLSGTRLSILFLIFSCLTYLSGRSQFTTTPDAQGNIFSNNTGNVGIGTNAPQIKLHVNGGGIGTTTYDGQNNLHSFVELWPENALIWKGGQGTSFRLGSAADLFATGFQEFMRVSDVGNVGIATTTPGASLEIGYNNNWISMLRVGISGNRANTNVQMLNSLAVLGVDNHDISVSGAMDAG